MHKEVLKTSWNSAAYMCVQKKMDFERPQLFYVKVPVLHYLYKQEITGSKETNTCINICKLNALLGFWHQFYLKKLNLVTQCHYNYFLIIISLFFNQLYILLTVSYIGVFCVFQSYCIKTISISLLLRQIQAKKGGTPYEYGTGMSYSFHKYWPTSY